MRLARKTVRPRLSKWFANVGRWDMIASLAGSDTKNALLLARVFQDKFHQYDCSEKLSAQGPRPAKVSKPWPMGHWQGARLTKRAELLARIFQDKFHQHDCPQKLVPKTFQTVSKRWAKGHAGHVWEKVLCWRGFHFARRSVRRCLVFASLQRSRLNDNPSIGYASA